MTSVSLEGSRADGSAEMACLLVRRGSSRVDGFWTAAPSKHIQRERSFTLSLTSVELHRSLVHRISAGVTKRLSLTVFPISVKVSSAFAMRNKTNTWFYPRFLNQNHLIVINMIKLSAPVSMKKKDFSLMFTPK